MRDYLLRKNVLLLLFCICPCLLLADYWTPWTEYPANPVYSPLPDRAYYPTVQYDKNQFSGHGISAYYKMWSDSPAPISLAISSDGIAWSTVGDTTGLINGRHSVVLYDADGFGDGDGYYYKIWYWNSADATTINGFRHAKSVDGLTWALEGSCTQDPFFPLVSGSGYFVNFFGPSTVIYNKDATNQPGNPMTFRYVLYYIGGAAGLLPFPNNLQWDNTCLAYSTDGINWTRYGSLPVLLPTGNLVDWDGCYATSASVIKTQDLYHMWYSGSTPNGDGNIKGIGYASSLDGINWTRALTNPIFAVTDGKAWRNLRTYACCVLFDADYFGEPADNKALKMWFSGLSTPSGVYSVGYATSNFLTNAAVSTVIADPVEVVANGTSKSTITVTLKATEGQPIVGSTVTLAPNFGSSIITPASGVSDANGQVTFSVTDTVIETVIYTATDTTNNVVITEEASVSFVEGPLPPSRLNGKQKKNDFSVVYELFNLLQWGPSPTSGIEGYYIYRNGVKIAVVGASTFKFEDHNRKKGVTTHYSVTSFIGDNESTPINVIIK